MRAQMPLALFALVFGTLEAAGGVSAGRRSAGRSYRRLAAGGGNHFADRFPARGRSRTGHRLDFSAGFYTDGHRHAPGGLADHGSRYSFSAAAAFRSEKPRRR